MLTLTECKLPSFSLKAGGKSNQEIPGKSIQIDFFENKSSLASSSASIQLTEGIRDIVLTQSKKELTADKGDWIVEGVINDYNISPISIQAGTDVAAQNRLTMSVRFNWEYFGELDEANANMERVGESSVSAFVDYDSQSNFASVEGELLDELVRQLSQDVYDKIFGGKW